MRTRRRSASLIATNTFSAPGTTVSTSGFSAGDYTLKAQYNGNVTWAASNGQATGTYTSTSTNTTLQATPSLAASGVPVTLTATVSSTGGPPPGDVTFLDGTTVLGTRTLNAGVATLTTSALALGGHTVKAAYAGSGSFADSTSSPVTVQIVQTPPKTTAALSPSPNTAGWFHGPVTATLTAVPGAGGSPVAATYFAIDVPGCAPSSPAACSAYGGPFQVSGNGVHTVTFFSRDASGAVEAARTLKVRIDGSRPVLHVSAWPGGSGPACFPHRGTVLHLSTADGPGSGIAGIRFQVWGAGGGPATFVAGATATVPVSAYGLSVLSATATDRAGNASRTVREWVLVLHTRRSALTCTASGGT